MLVSISDAKTVAVSTPSSTNEKESRKGGVVVMNLQVFHTNTELKVNVPS
jgi:hypothetical protein